MPKIVSVPIPRKGLKNRNYRLLEIQYLTRLTNTIRPNIKRILIGIAQMEQKNVSWVIEEIVIDYFELLKNDKIRLGKYDRFGGQQYARKNGRLDSRSKSRFAKEDKKALKDIANKRGIH